MRAVIYSAKSRTRVLAWQVFEYDRRVVRVDAITVPAWMRCGSGSRSSMEKAFSEGTLSVPGMLGFEED